MTTLLTSKQADALRSIGDSAMVLFALWMIDQNYPGRMTTADELKPYLYPHIKDKRKIESQLNALCASGRLTQTSAGYVLLEGGKALLLGMTEHTLQENKALASSPATVAGTITAQALNEVVEVVASDVYKKCARNARAFPSLKKIEEDGFNLIRSSSSDSDLKKSAQNSSKIPLSPGTEEAWVSQNLKVGESAIVPKIMGYTFEDGTPVYQMDRGDGTFITTREILDATEVIEGFGDIEAQLPVDAIKPELALAWIAKGCNDRGKLTKPPAGLVCARLQQIPQSQPPRRYLKNPMQYLPDEYCAELGLSKYDCKSCVDAKFSTRAALDDHVQKMHVVPESDVEFTDIPVKGALDIENPGNRAWVAVLEALQMEMPRASFETWVRDAKPVLYDGQVMTVGVRNAYCRDWLESRLQSRINDLLIGILNRQVAVRFVVADLSEE